ncbi:hypothetical protein [Streptomyces kanamyceticus]|uniref:Uncharacterized protein n=1 Tax=Streptomyces kanamyceticus TaxID=1967 RepID=A0A5J6G9R2_STRKN|nr:hypothetical protein [Streptomyces kanamyceticus]QEU92540.1 hypothetical protein CP970_17955 [Streptomyces kanamyceticus]
MTDITSERPTTRRSPLRAAPLPDPPGAAESWPGRSELLRSQEQALDTLVREDLSRARAGAFLLCALAVSFTVMLVPAGMADTLTSDTSNGVDVAVSVVLSALLLVGVTVPALLVLRKLHTRTTRRWHLLREWAAVDRGHDSLFPTAYGAQAPHARFFNAGVALLLVITLAGILIASATDPQAAAALPGTVVAGLFAWAPVKKYAARYGWAARERVVRARERMRHQHRDQLTGTASTPRSGIHPAALLYFATIAPTAVIGIIFVVARPKNAAALAVLGLLALSLLALGAPLVQLRRRRERALLAEAADALLPSFPVGTVVHPVRYGLNEQPAHTRHNIAAAPSAWDDGPSRTGALAVQSGTLHLRGTDGGALEVPLADLTGVVFLPSTVAWLHPSVDLLLSSGGGIELRSPQAKGITAALADSGVPVVTP